MLEAPLGPNFGVLGPPWATILRVWGYPWADLVRSCCERTLVAESAAPFWTIYERKCEPKGSQNGAKILKKSVQSSIEKSMPFWVAFFIGFCVILGAKIDGN